MPRTPGEDAGWLGAIGLVVRVLGSILELAILSFWSICVPVDRYATRDIGWVRDVGWVRDDVCRFALDIG